MNLAPLCHTEESFEKLQPYSKALVKELAEAIEPLGVLSPYQAKPFLQKVLRKHGIDINSETFYNLDADDSIELWTSNFKFLFAMGPVLLATSYTLDQLTGHDWSDLFEREEEMMGGIVKRTLEAIETGVTQYNVTPWHLVSEKMSEEKKTMQVKVNQIIPFANPEFQGVMVLVKLKRPGLPEGVIEHPLSFLRKHQET